MRKVLIITITIFAVLAIAVYFFWPKHEDVDIIPDDRSNMIVVVSPVKDSIVGSPLSVAGRARGTWFFEGSFPIILQDTYGNILAESHATAQGEWMTEEFVNFLGSIQFNNHVKGSSVFLILKKDNPSGLPEHDDSTKIPIILK